MDNEITIEVLNKLFDDLEESRQHLPEKPLDGEPITLSDEELVRFRSNGSIVKHWRDGSYSVIMTTEKRDRILKLLGG